jgi:hypothetical protein
MVMSEFVTENKREGKWNRHRYTHKRRWLHVGNCLWAVAVGNAAITVGNKRSGGGSISSASSWLSLYSIFLVVSSLSRMQTQRVSKLGNFDIF